jgi:O-antigen ligase
MLILISFRKSKFAGIFSLGISISLMILGLLGTLQKGVLSSLLFQESLSFRGDYWRAGISMFKANWPTGVGLDSYGDYYRFYRDDAAAGRRGLSTLSNSAHNIFIDLASTGGILLLISYSFLLILVTTYVVKFMRARKESDFSFQALVVIWLAFNLQTLISINVSSLAIWGWISGGLIISHVQQRLTQSPEDRVTKSKQVRTFSRIPVIALSLCLLLVSPLVFKQVILAEAFRKQYQEKIVNGVLMFPRDADQIAGIATVFKKIGNDKRSIEMAQLAVESNARAFGAWELMFQGTETPEQLRDIAKAQLIALEPRYFNSSFKKSG